MTVHSLVVYPLALIFQYVHNAHAQEISGEILANELNKVADAVGLSFIQVKKKIKSSSICTS